MRTYSLFTQTKEQKEISREGNKAIREAISNVVKAVKWAKRAKQVETDEQVEYLTGVKSQRYIRPILAQFAIVGAYDTEPREVIAIELSAKLGVHISTSLI